jgi:hypothetical protein
MDKVEFGFILSVLTIAWRRENMSNEDFAKKEWIVYSGENVDKEYEQFICESWGVCCGFELVGHGKITSNKCGSFLGFYGCLRVDLHDLTSLDGQNFKGKAYIKKRFHSCDSPECPVCYRSWAAREAFAIDYRLKEASKKFGVIEHFIISTPREEYGLSYERLKANCVKALRSRGVLGSCLVFHPFRYISRDEAHRKGVVFGFRFSPHWHALGFLDGGYSKCRHCTKNVRSYISGAGKLLESRGGMFACAGCGGFESLTRRCYEKDHYIVKVQGARKTVGGTAFYELQHCGFVRGKSRSRVVCWWGVVSYAKLRLKKRERHLDLCPICQNELVRLKYVGNGDPLVESWLKEFCDSLVDEHGSVKWIEVPEDRFSYGLPF